MPDPAIGTVEHDRPNESAPPPAVASAPFGVPGDGELKPGQRWRDFVIEAPLPGGPPHTYLADNIGLMEKVILRALPIVESTEWRRGAWERLAALADSKTLRCIEAHEESGWRYEVTSVPPPMSLREWIACHRPDFGEIEMLVRQLVATLGALHAQGVVHLNISPDAIHLDESGAEPVFILGGLHEATLYTQPHLMPADVNPFYAPPESAEQTEHPPGTRLCAWDWWSVGRVVQEFLLGRHVLGLVLDRDVSKMTPELRAQANLLLLETAPAGVRAGALDYMPADPTTAPLLRGLLTSSFEARWGLDAVQRWLRHEPVQDHYDLPRHARLWTWRGRGFTLVEAAEFFTQAANWAEGENMLFHPHDPETLAHFLNDTPAQRGDWQRLQTVCELTESNGWEEVPVVVRRTVTAAAAWLALAIGSGARATFRLRGQTVDVAGLTELLKGKDGSEGVSLVMALLSPALIAFLEPLDPAAARVLKGIGANGGAAVQRALRHGWLDPHDADGQAHVLGLAMQRATALRDRVALLHATYATCRDPALAQMMADRAPGPVELVILAYTSEAPERHGYITHANWRRDRYLGLKTQADELTAAFFWLRLSQLLAIARPWASSKILATITLALAAGVGWLGRSAGPAAAIIAVLALPRIWLWWRVRGMARRFSPATAEWMWRDGLERSRAEAARSLSATKLTTAELSEKQYALHAAMAEFATAAPGGHAADEPQWWDVRLVLTAGALLAVVVAGDAVAQWRSRISAAPLVVRRAEGVGKPDSARAAPAIAAPATFATDAKSTTDRLLATGRYEVIDDGFGRRLRGPLRKWDFFAPVFVPALAVQARAPASPEQTAFALVSATLLMQPYFRTSLNVLLAVRVPTTRGVGLLLYNTRDRELVDREVRLVAAPLKERTWYQFGVHRAVYLGTPAALESEISLAQP